MKSLIKLYRRKLQDEFEVFPRELLVSEKLDLHRWSFMINDEALEYLANVTYKRSEAAVEEAARKEKMKEDEKTKSRNTKKKLLPPGVGQSRMDILELARSQMKKKKKLLPQCSLLNIHEAPKITDVGLQHVGESCAMSLRVLDIGGCRSVTRTHQRNRQSMMRTKHRVVNFYKSRTHIGLNTTTNLLERSTIITGIRVKVHMIVQTV